MYVFLPPESFSAHILPFPAGKRKQIAVAMRKPAVAPPFRAKKANIPCQRLLPFANIFGRAGLMFLLFQGIIKA